ncbi:MAG: hypothetical protein BMS9Abin26_0843 [Gammaproteobacteria bacterium]|nr:MAG: hypothetical protein BMS9Abin26_0843 [Gammaproteobacteria bacterium]
MNTSLRYYDPWKDLEGFRTELSRLFGHPVLHDEESTVSDWMPAVDVKEKEDRYVIEADVPGVDPKEIEIHMENGILTIKGERHSEKTEAEAGHRRVERVYGSFYRRFSLPDTADAENIKANSKHGVLEITIPKQTRVQPRRIEING